MRLKSKWGFDLGPTIIFMMMVLSFGCTGCGPRPGHWRMLAGLTNSAGDCFIVAQEHYDWAEGWRVSFTMLNSNKVYGALLEMETGPWHHVELKDRIGTVEVLRNGKVVAVYGVSDGTFSNCLAGTCQHLSPASDSLQGQQLPINFVFE